MIEPKQAVKDLKGYPPVRQDRKDFVRLDMSENNCPFVDLYGLSLPDNGVSRYPSYGTLMPALSELYGVPEDHILLYNGSDDALMMVPYTFIEPGADSAVISSPCFVVIKTALQMAGARLIEIPVLRSLAFDIEGLEQALHSAPKMVMLANPDNPTGALLQAETIEDWVERFPQTLFLIDEAYAEYSGVSVIPLCLKRSNLLVTRTFSKAWAMAGLRFGVLIGDPSLLQWLRKFRPPFNVNSAAAFAATNLAPYADGMENSVAHALVERARMVAELSSMGYSVTNGFANFFLVHVAEQAGNLCAHLEDKGILVRNCSGSTDSNDSLWGVVKISVGTYEQNDLLLKSMLSFRTTASLQVDHR